MPQDSYLDFDHLDVAAELQPYHPQFMNGKTAMLIPKEKAIAAKVIGMLARPVAQDADAHFRLWSHGGWDMDEDEVQHLRGVLKAFAAEHKITVAVPDADDNT